jgi:hypothetical protein
MVRSGHYKKHHHHNNKKHRTIKKITITITITDGEVRKSPLKTQEHKNTITISL